MGQNCKQERFAIACEKVIGSLWSARIQYGLYRAWCAVLLLLVMMIMVSSAQVISVTGVNQKIADP